MFRTLKTKKNECFLIAIMLLSVLLIGYMANYKEYLYIDEVGSYTASNNPSGIFYQLSTDTWYQGTDFVTPLTAQNGHTFDYNLVWENQTNDTHPPLYFILLHTICSFFPGVFSKWFALSVNILSLLIIEIVVYKIAKLLFRDNQWMPLVCVAAYAGSISVVTQALFLRMYMVQQIFTSLALLIHIKILYGKTKNKYFFPQLFLITVLGTLTQYYYLIFAFFLAVGYCINLLFTKKFKEIIYYVITMILSAASVILIFPATIKHLFGGEVGSTVVGNVLQLNRVKERLVTIYAILNQQIFGSCFKLLLLITACFLITKAYQYSKNQSIKKIFKERKFSDSYIWTVMFAIALLYYLLVSLITPYLCDRYFAPIFLILILLLVKTLSVILKDVFKSENLMYIILTALLLAPVYQQFSSDLTDTNKQIMLQTASENADTICMVEPDINLENFKELGEYQNIYVVDMHQNFSSNSVIQNNNQFIIYLPDDIEVENVYQEIQETNPLISRYERLYVGYRATVYKFY